MIIEFDAESNTTGFVHLFCNNVQLWSHNGKQFHTSVNVEPSVTNFLDVHWICSKVEDVKLIINKILIAEQKINLLKSFYIPTKEYKKFIKHQVLHQGHMLWPGMLRFYWKHLKRNEYTERKKTDTNLIRKYNWIYD